MKEESGFLKLNAMNSRQDSLSELFAVKWASASVGQKPSKSANLKVESSTERPWDHTMDKRLDTVTVKKLWTTLSDVQMVVDINRHAIFGPSASAHVIHFRTEGRKGPKLYVGKPES